MLIPELVRRAVRFAETHGQFVRDVANRWYLCAALPGGPGALFQAMAVLNGRIAADAAYAKALQAPRAVGT